MVLSKLDHQVSYPEVKSISKSDLNREAELYNRTFEGVNILIGLGKPQDTFQEQNIIFFPIYLVKSNRKVVQIGVYEVPAIDLNKF